MSKHSKMDSIDLDDEHLDSNANKCACPHNQMLVDELQTIAESTSRALNILQK